MKKTFFAFFMLLALLASNVYCQIAVNSSGDMILNDHNLYLHKATNSNYGIGYNKYGGNEFVLYSDNLLDFRESDANALVAQFSFDNKTANFYGHIGFNRAHTKGGIISSNYDFQGSYSMTALYPNTHWYGILGTSTKWWAGAYIDHIWYTYIDQLPSDERLKENIVDLDSSLIKILALRPVKYDIIPSHYDSIPQEARQYLINMNKNRLGFLAQDVQKVIPEIVHQEYYSGMYSLSTIDIIPILVKAMQEQQSHIEQLQTIISEQEEEIISIKEKIGLLPPSDSKKSLETSIEDIQNTPVLYQNNPNPFNKDTEIKFYIPYQTIEAKLYLYDMQGSRIRSMVLHQRGYGTEIIHASDLQPGMYIYTLIVNGFEVISKTMILTDL